MIKLKTMGWSGPATELTDEIALNEACFAWGDMTFLVYRRGEIPFSDGVLPTEFRFTDGACWSDWKNLGTEAQLVRLLGVIAEVIFTSDDRYESLIHEELLKVTEYRNLLVERGVCQIL